MGQFAKRWLSSLMRTYFFELRGRNLWLMTCPHVPVVAPDDDNLLVPFQIPDTMSA